MRVLNTKRIHLASKINYNFALVLKAIFSNRVILTLVVIIKG